MVQPKILVQRLREDVGHMTDARRAHRERSITIDHRHGGWYHAAMAALPISQHQLLTTHLAGRAFR